MTNSGRAPPRFPPNPSLFPAVITTTLADFSTRVLGSQGVGSAGFANRKPRGHTGPQRRRTNKKTETGSQESEAKSGEQ